MRGQQVIHVRRTMLKGAAKGGGGDRRLWWRVLLVLPPEKNGKEWMSLKWRQQTQRWVQSKEQKLNKPHR
jgi:hypothetical protein